MTDDPRHARFEQLYADAARGGATVPWDLPHPGAAVVEWARERDLSGLRTLVVGCGLGRDAQYLAGRGAVVVAFDVAPTAVAVARERHPDSQVEYVVADLLAPPAGWRAAFDLVVENMNVQALADPERAAAVAALGRFVAPGGELVVVEIGRDDDAAPADGPPWPFTRAEVLGFADDGLRLVDLRADPPTGPVGRWTLHAVREGAGVTR